MNFSPLVYFMDYPICVNITCKIEYGNFLFWHILTITATNKCNKQQYI